MQYILYHLSFNLYRDINGIKVISLSILKYDIIFILFYNCREQSYNGVPKIRDRYSKFNPN